MGAQNPFSPRSAMPPGLPMSGAGPLGQPGAQMPQANLGAPGQGMNPALIGQIQQMLGGAQGQAPPPNQATQANPAMLARGLMMMGGRR